jgi:hypothetical protein
VPRGQRDESLRPYSRFSRQEPLLFYQVAPQLYSRVWVDLVPDPLLFFLVVPVIEPGPPELQPRTLTTRPHRRSHPKNTYLKTNLRHKDKIFCDVETRCNMKSLLFLYDWKVLPSSSQDQQCGQQRVVSLISGELQSRPAKLKNWTPCSESASELYRPRDRRSSAKWLPTFADRGCHVVSVTDPYGRILGFIDRSRYFSIK